MRLHLIVGQRPCRYEGEYLPEVIACWDEGSVDENPDGFNADLLKAQGSVSFEAVRMVIVEVDTEAFTSLFETPTVKGEVSDGSRG